MRLFLRLCFVLGVAACKTSPGDGGVPRVPLVHRPVALACPTDRPAVDCGAGNPSSPGGACKTDSECTDSTMGTNGRCAGGGHALCSCSYDACTSDAACASDSLCSCRAANESTPNKCLPSNCRTDADCGDNYRSPSLDPTCGAYFGVTLWHCHTAKDTCVDDSDCANLDGGFGAPFCGYQPELGHWKCSTAQCAG